MVQVIEIFLHGRQGAICPRYNTMATNDLPMEEASNIWGRQGPGGPHVGPMNRAIWVVLLEYSSTSNKYIIGFVELFKINKEADIMA